MFLNVLVPSLGSATINMEFEEVRIAWVKCEVWGIQNIQGSLCVASIFSCSWYTLKANHFLFCIHLPLQSCISRTINSSIYCTCTCSLHIWSDDQGAEPAGGHVRRGCKWHVKMYKSMETDVKIKGLRMKYRLRVCCWWLLLAVGGCCCPYMLPNKLQLKYECWGDALTEEQT